MSRRQLSMLVISLLILTIVLLSGFVINLVGEKDRFERLFSDYSREIISRDNLGDYFCLSRGLKEGFYYTVSPKNEIPYTSIVCYDSGGFQKHFTIEAGAVYTFDNITLRYCSLTIANRTSGLALDNDCRFVDLTPKWGE